MLVGELIQKSATAIYTTPAYREAGSATFAVHVLQINGTSTPTLDCDIEHRDSTEDSWATAASFTSMTSTGVHTKAASSLKELVRLKFTLNTGSTDTWMRVFILPPNW